jgi:Cft2 family RNA processing exonuclease
LRQGDQQKIQEVFGVEKIHCGVETFYFSAHSHREELIRMVEQLRPRQVILCHGEVSSQRWMKERLEKDRLAQRVILPEKHQEILLS